MSACRRWITPPYCRTRITLTPPHQSPWRLSYPRTKKVSWTKHNERLNMSSANMFKVFIVGTGMWFIKRPLSGGLLTVLTKASVLEIEATYKYYRETWISFCSVSKFSNMNMNIYHNRLHQEFGVHIQAWWGPRQQHVWWHWAALGHTRGEKRCHLSHQTVQRHLVQYRGETGADKSCHPWCQKISHSGH